MGAISATGQVVYFLSVCFSDFILLASHLLNNQVYTRLAPKSSTATPPPPWKPLSPLAEEAKSPSDEKPQMSLPTPPSNDAPVLPLISNKSEPIGSLNAVPDNGPAAALSRLDDPSQDSQVLSDTLNVIDEHITDLRSPASNAALRVSHNDSGSEYSAALDARMSYIQGEETDEEEEETHSRLEVEAWSPDDVAEYLFSQGVEKQHCEVFRDQDITGEVLLTMDQSSLFIKAFDLGSVGRRLKTWHKIKALQDEVDGLGLATRRTTQTYGSDVAPEDAARHRIRTSTLSNSVSQRPGSSQARRRSATQTGKSPAISNSNTIAEGQSHYRRPSAASIRDLHHSRRHSSTDYQIPGGPTPRLSSHGTFPGTETIHKKQPSFDRNWTLGAASSSQNSPRPLSSAGFRGVGGSSDPDLQDSAVDLDRGYFSGTEADSKGRKLLRKRDSTHSRQQSYAEEQRVRSATALSRHSRFGSDSFRDSAPSPAAQKYYGVTANSHRKTASTATTESVRPRPPSKDGLPPTVTKLEGKAPPPPAKDGDWLSSFVTKPMSKTGSGIRNLSDSLGFDRSKSRASGDAATRDFSLPSPAPTGSSTPSGGPSLDLESPDANKNPGGMVVPPRNKPARKGKKETSAYTRGLQKIGPKEAAKSAEYSGWMRKKSSNLMTTWKPRFFVLNGRRLAYYYSEDDTEEKGLIDISFHRVLPADNEKLTGLHATISGAVGGQPMPSSEESEPLDKGDDSIFIFKLMPPRAGLSRAVHFTKPTVHYFAVPNLKQGRLWMAALMKATIDRDEMAPMTTTYQHKTISLAKAKQLRHRPPALRDLDEKPEGEEGRRRNDGSGPGASGEVESGIAGMDKGVAAALAAANSGETGGDSPQTNA